MDWEQNQQIAVEEMLNRLSADPGVKAFRSRASGWVKARLEENLRRELLPGALAPGAWERFRGREDPEWSEITERILERFSPGQDWDAGELALSGRERAELGRLLRVTRQGAAEWLWERSEKKRYVAFRKQAGVPPATLSRFLDDEVMTGEDVVGRLAAGLDLGPEETERLVAMAPKETFRDLSRLRPGLRALRQEQKLSVSELLRRSYLAESAWEPFREDAGADAVTSKKTLLKLIIGLRLTPEQAKDFLALADTIFFTRRDLVVLACMYCGIYEAPELWKYLDRYSQAYGQKLYRNLYREDEL